jgi:hypothetical protein
VPVAITEHRYSGPERSLRAVAIHAGKLFRGTLQPIISMAMEIPVA